MYTISRGFFNVKKLEKVEVEEVARSIQTELSVSEKQQMYLPSNIVGPSDPSNEWLLPSDFALSPGLFVDLGIPNNVETPSDIRSSF